MISGDAEIPAWKYVSAGTVTQVLSGKQSPYPELLK